MLSVVSDTLSKFSKNISHYSYSFEIKIIKLNQKDLL